MRLNQEEIILFYKLWYSLVWSINEKYSVIPHFPKPVYGTRVAVSIEEFKKIRDEMWDNPEWIDEFLRNADNDDFTEQERSIIALWRKYFVKGRFIVTRHLAKYSVLMSFDGGDNMLYCVCGISDSIKDTFPQPTPFLLNVVLLPFKGRIIYDSLAAGYNVYFGPGYRDSVKVWYNEAKAKYGFIEVLNGETPQAKPIVKKP